MPREDHFTLEKLVGLRNWLENVITSGPFFSVTVFGSILDITIADSMISAMPTRGSIVSLLQCRNCCATSAQTSGQYSGFTLRPFAGPTAPCPSVRSKINFTSGQNRLSASCGVNAGSNGLGRCRMRYSGDPIVRDACVN